MHFSIDLNTVLQSLAIAGIVGIFKQLWTMNGSMGRMKTWQEQHELSDNERFTDLRSQVRDLRVKAGHE